MEEKERGTCGGNRTCALASNTPDSLAKKRSRKNVKNQKREGVWELRKKKEFILCAATCMRKALCRTKRVKVRVIGRQKGKYKKG